jgi:hypothetical protein
VSHDRLFEKIDFDRTMQVFENADKIARKRTVTEAPTRKGSGLINEDYLRSLVRDEVRFEVENVAESIVERLTYQIERIVAAAFFTLSENTESEKVEEVNDEV